MLSVYCRTFYPHQFIQRMVLLRGWHLVQRHPPIVDVNGQIVALSPRYFDTLFGEWPSWRSIYLPRFSIKGMTILDIGSGCGETALFFFSHGAKKVICVEPDRENMDRLRKNASHNGWNVETIQSGFETRMLDWEFDYMKMDCEGCEQTLLELDSIPPCSIEVHDFQTHQKLVDKFHLRTIARDKRGTWIVQNT